MKVEPFVSSKDGAVIGYTFECPGCKEQHAVYVNNPEPGPNWTFNGDVNNPTFSPSLLVQSGHYAGHHKPGDDCWCTYNEQHPEEKVRFTCYVCHSFIRDGKIQFLSDCTHALAGQTIELPEIEE